jgi:NTP pyrophosphatase (non-canonical NTP hydrolase)
MRELQDNMTENPGYHLTEIPRGEYGEISKILEEAAELKDAMEQGNKLMVLIELADLLGAVDGYLDRYYGDKMTIDNLITMADATKRVFKYGHRKPTQTNK